MFALLIFEWSELHEQNPDSECRTFSAVTPSTLRGTSHCVEWSHSLSDSGRAPRAMKPWLTATKATLLVTTGETVAAMRRAPLAEGSDVGAGWGRGFLISFHGKLQALWTRFRYRECILSGNYRFSLCGHNSLARVGGRLREVKLAPQTSRKEVTNL